jgi:hypothetical protein
MTKTSITTTTIGKIAWERQAASSRRWPLCLILLAISGARFNTAEVATEPTWNLPYVWSFQWNHNPGAEGDTSGAASPARR